MDDRTTRDQPSIQPAISSPNNPSPHPLHAGAAADSPFTMNNEGKPQPDAEDPHMEKQTMTQPQEEFVADQSVPSKSMQDAGNGGVQDVKDAGHQEKKDAVFEPGVEG